MACARPAGVIVPMDQLFVGIDWAPRSDFTWVTVVIHQNDVIDWLKAPHVTYPEQVDLIRVWMAQYRGGWAIRIVSSA